MEHILTLASVMLFLAGGYFLLKFRAFFLIHPIKTLRLVPKEGIGQMLLSLGGAVGVGNIVGVSVALSLGGSGAVFWMLVSAVFAMAIKYAEITLGMLHGGAIGYIKAAFGRLAASFFAILLVADSVVTGAIIQSNAIGESAESAFGIDGAVCGIFLSIAVASVLLFKVDLFKLSSLIVPLMSIGYAVLSLAVIVYNFGMLDEVLREIFVNAFDFSSVAGGFFGFAVTPAMRQGVVKGVFSNEAGCGTAPMAHAASKEKIPARQGLFGIFEVYVDTVLMCTLTAMALLVTGNGENAGVFACINAFSTVFGGFAAPTVAICTFFFAFASIISFGYYGKESLAFLSRSEKMAKTFFVLYSVSVFVGASVTPLLVWKIADITVSVMLLINVSAVLKCRKGVLCAHENFYTQIGKKSHSASSTLSFSKHSTKNEIPMSETEINSGFTQKFMQNFAK